MIIIDSKNDLIKFFKINKDNKHNEKILFKGFFKISKKDNIKKIQEFTIEYYSKNISLTDGEAINLLKNDDIILINENNVITTFLKQEKINYSSKLLCYNCKKNYEIKLLNNDGCFRYKDRTYCKLCAKELIDYLIYTYGYVIFMQRKYDYLLEKYQNIEDILKIMEEDYNPLVNDNLTLYDTLPVTENEYEKIKIDDLDLPDELKDILSKRIDNLLPVQISSIKSGLLDGENLLVVSQTASGKTLIGELAGIPKAMNNKKMIYLSPLVALANQKYRDFKRDYEKLGLSVAIKVGHNRIKTEDELYIQDKPINDADIIVATYEGLDFILRSGNYKDLEDLGTVVIDEIHMLENEERGHRLNGLINRLTSIFPKSQIIGLSATIKNANLLAHEFSMKLVEYNKRPVKIERHFVSAEDDKEKNNLIVNLCKKEFEMTSSKGFHGQTIIFTDSRRKTQILASKLKKNGVNAEYYHAGLTYSKKIEIEESFINQEISTVVTTAALANGIDFPASMVIFESIHMGIDYLTNNEFHQMVGRAGRPTYHDIGKAYTIVVSPDNVENNFNRNDYKIALELLKNDVDSIQVLYDKMDVYEQVLSDICAIPNVDLDNLKNRYDNMWIPITFNESISLLVEKNMIVYDNVNSTYFATEYGKAVSKSFITVMEAETIKSKIFDDIIEIVITLELIHNAYFSDAILNKLSSIFNYNVGSNIFSDRSKEIIVEGGYINYLGQRFQNKLININKDLMECDCFNHYCDCFKKNISRHIINRRIQGWTPNEINREFLREYEIIIYSGDIYSYLNQVVMKLEAIKKISYSLNITSTGKKCEKLINKIEEGR
ncbi:MAG: DEAD/DEAH box helicase [Methanosphaera stadtmanae]|nr:DEAD/DEAH box helicase [Methanosphaera stadtmanae]